MKKSLILFLQGTVILIGVSVLIFMLYEPHLEGRNVNATFFEIYFKDLFLAYVYVASIPFFVAFYKVFKLLGYVGHNRVSSPESLKALRTIKHCALILTACIIGAEAYFFTAVRGSDDIAGGVMMGLLMMCISIIVALIAAGFERRLGRVGEPIQ